VLARIRDTGDLGDEEAFEAAIAAFADQFVPAEHGGELPEAEAQADAETSIATSSRHLPEEDVDRDGDEPR
jgi:hypothetical protein